jgi:hypothetical protein
MPLSGRAGPSVSLEFCMPRAKSNVGILDDDVGADDVGRHQGRELDAREDRPLLELEVLPSVQLLDRRIAHAQLEQEPGEGWPRTTRRWLRD